MTNKNFMIIQRAVRKYGGIYEKSQSGHSTCLPTDFNKKKFWSKSLENIFNFFFNFYEFKNLNFRTQIFPKIDKNDFNTLKHIYTG